VHRSSPSIASLAAALAKAQAELVNPEKSMTATIRSDERGGTEQTFRYAPLSSGLDIVRKTLGQHEIATVQTTAIDQAAGIVNLTTVLAHASGEWIASDWPVCGIAETASPHRMGAALTYARRYALFTLVGIAGEDDIDAPDLTAPRPGGLETQKPGPNPKSHLNGGRSAAPGPIPGRRAGTDKPSTPMLDATASAALREQLVAELQAIASEHDATAWAQRILGAKNRLIAADARQVEDVFAAKLASFAPATKAGDAPARRSPSELVASVDRWAPEALETSSGGREVDKSHLAHPEPRRVRDKEHVRFVAKQPCLVCGRRPADPHHLRFAQHRALGRKVSDEFTVPLCRGHHREVHRCGDEAAWWMKAGIDPTIPARALWLESHPLPTASNKTDLEGTTTLLAVNTGDSQRGRPTAKGGPKYKTKPIIAAGPSSGLSRRTQGI